jgi:hypothetical protein
MQLVGGQAIPNGVSRKPIILTAGGQLISLTKDKQTPQCLVIYRCRLTNSSRLDNSKKVSPTNLRRHEIQTSKKHFNPDSQSA